MHQFLHLLFKNLTLKFRTRRSLFHKHNFQFSARNKTQSNKANEENIGLY